MEKVSVMNLTNDFCPQSLFLYGTYKEDGAPNFGLFCWFSYCWDKELHVMACIGGEKLTKDRIHAKKVFSANLVTEPLLPLADYLGNTSGYDKGKMIVPIETIHGAVLDVPILKSSPWSYELEVVQSVSMDDGELFICKVHNILAAKELMDDTLSIEERIRLAAPILTTKASYFSINPTILGTWGDWKDHLAKPV